MVNSGHVPRRPDRELDRLDRVVEVPSECRVEPVAFDPGTAAVDRSVTANSARVRGDLLTPTEAGGFALALKADAFWVRTESNRVSSTRSTPGERRFRNIVPDIMRNRA